MPQKDSPKLKAYRNSGILEKWHGATFKQFVNDDKALAKVIAYVEEVDTCRKKGYGMYLFGSNGTGKTHLMMCAFKGILDKGYSVRVVSLGTLITRFVSTWYDAANSKAFYEDLKNVDFLGIEELGKEYRSMSSSGQSDLGLTVLDSILRYRLHRVKPTWFTSNLKPSELNASYSIDVSSMLKEACLPVVVKGNSRTDFRDNNADAIQKYFDGITK